MAAALILAGCGGGSSGGTPTPDPGAGSPAVSGTAAAGAPLVGFVVAKDAGDNTAPPAQISADGSFELDLSGLTTPTLIFASGVAGGNAYELLSVVFDDDVNGTVNITPLTDLIVGNAVGDTPREFFNNPTFSLITQEAVEQQEENLKTRLKPLLDGLAVEDDFDLRNSTFIANRSGFDAVLDVLEVTVDPDTNTAVIRNRVDDTQISNTFQQPETGPLPVNENLQQNVTTLQALNTLAQAAATALESQDGAALQALVTNDFLNNGEEITGLQDRLFNSAPGIEDAEELATEIRNWSLVDLSDDGTTARLNVGAAQGPWNAVNENGEWKLQGNQLEFFVFVEPTHLIENGAQTPEVLSIGTLVWAGFPAASLGELTDSTVTVSGDLSPFNGDLPLDAGVFASFQVLAADAISSGDQVTFTWNNSVEGVIDSQATFTIRRGTPNLSNGAPTITAQSADLATNEYTFEWTLPPGYDAISVRNNFTGQQSGGVGESEDAGFTGNALTNNATSFTGALPASYVPSAGDELRIITRDPFGVFVSARLINPFADQIPPPMAEDALIGSWIARNPDNNNSPWVQLTFLENGYYMHQELDLPYRPEADDAGNTGVELGRYQWDNVTGELTVPEITFDDNGEWGLTSTANGEEQLTLSVDGNTLTAAFGPSIDQAETVEFARVPLNQSGIIGSWVIQDDQDSTSVSVLTILDDGFYLIGTTQPADQTGSPGLELGTYVYDSETLVFNPAPEVDQNGEFGLSDPIQGFDFATVIDGFLIIDDAEAFQLSEIAPGVSSSNGDVTVDYTAPDTGSGSDPTPGTAVSGNFHYLRNFSGIEGQMAFDPPLVFQATYNHVDTTVADNGDGTGSINWTEICLGDLIVDANTDPFNSTANFEFANECLPASADSFDVSFTDAGLSASFTEETITDPEDGTQFRRGAGSLGMTAVDANRSLFIGQSARDFGFEQPEGFVSEFSDGVEISTHVLSEKTTGRTQAELAGRWGLVTRYLTGIEGQPDELDYSANSLIVDVDAAGSVTRLSEIDRTIIQGLAAGQSFVQIEFNPEDTTQEPLGTMPITDDGTVSLFGGEFGGILSSDANVLFLSLINPMEVQQALTDESEWIAGVRLADNFSAADLEGKEYTFISQNYWIQPGRFEADYLNPDATLTFPVGGDPAVISAGFTFPNVPFFDEEPLTREADPVETSLVPYSVNTDGRIELVTDFGETNITEYKLSGFATPDARLLIFATTVSTKADDGTTDEGSIGISYAICTNCD